MSATIPPSKTSVRSTPLRVSPGTSSTAEPMVREPLIASPAPPAENTAARIAVRAGVPSQSMVSAPESILIIDDNADETQRMIEVLTGLYPRNLRVYHRDSGQSALEIIRRANVDVIFIGYHLIDMAGTEFISIAAEMLEDTAMILLGGAWDGPHTAAAMKSGARDFLDKSQLDAMMVREVIETALRSVRIDYRLTKTAAAMRANGETRSKQMESLSVSVKSTLAGLEDSLRELRNSARNLTVWELDEQIGLLESDLRASRAMVNQLSRS